MSGQLLGFDPSRQDEIPKFTPGREHRDAQGRLWKYVRANGAQTAGEVSQVAKDGTYDATPMTTTTVNSLTHDCVVPDIDVTDNYYYWGFAGEGEFEIVVVNGVTANSVLTSTGTAGEVGTGGTPVDGLLNIDAGVTSTRVTCFAHKRLSVGVTPAYD